MRSADDLAILPPANSHLYQLLHFLTFCVFLFTRQVPNGDVSGLPCNYVINNLLSKQSDPVPSCKKHDGEILKILCQSCNQLICRDCIAIDHRDHTCAFIKEIFPAEKQKISKTIEESRVNVRSLESSIETLKQQEDSINKNFLEVNQKLDSLIDRQIELLQMKRQSLKDELRKLVLIQKNNISTQKESFVSSLDRLKNRVLVTEKSLSKGTEGEVLLAKNQMIQQLTELSSATADLQVQGVVSYDLDAYPPLDENTVGEIAKIKEYDEEYKLNIVPDVPPFLANVHKEQQEALKSSGQFHSTFYIRPKRKNTRYSSDNEVQVKIKAPDSDYFHSPDINNWQDGSFTFSYHPRNKKGDYKIEVIINGRYLRGSPFTWEVR